MMMNTSMDVHVFLRLEIFFLADLTLRARLISNIMTFMNVDCHLIGLIHIVTWAPIGHVQCFICGLRVKLFLYSHKSAIISSFCNRYDRYAIVNTVFINTLARPHTILVPTFPSLIS